MYHFQLVDLSNYLPWMLNFQFLPTWAILLLHDFDTRWFIPNPRPSEVGEDGCHCRCFPQSLRSEWYNNTSLEWMPFISRTCPAPPWHSTEVIVFDGLPPLKINNFGSANFIFSGIFSCFIFGICLLLLHNVILLNKCLKINKYIYIYN